MIFDHFVYQTVKSLREQPESRSKDIVILMDNAVIHKHESVLRSSLQAGVSVLFNVEYSPMLNPIERAFQMVKTRFRRELASAHTK